MICTHGSLRGYHREVCPISSGKINKPTRAYYTTLESSPIIDRGWEEAESKKNKDHFEYLRGRYGSYLAGLIEADGSFAVHDKNSKAKRYTPKILIVFSLNDIPLAEKLISITGLGKLYIKKKLGCAI